MLDVDAVAVAASERWEYGTTMCVALEEDSGFGGTSWYRYVEMAY